MSSARDNMSPFTPAPSTRGSQNKALHNLDGVKQGYTPCQRVNVDGSCADNTYKSTDVLFFQARLPYSQYVHGLSAERYVGKTHTLPTSHTTKQMALRRCN